MGAFDFSFPIPILPEETGFDDDDTEEGDFDSGYIEDDVHPLREHAMARKQSKAHRLLGQDTPLYLDVPDGSPNSIGQTSSDDDDDDEHGASPLVTHAEMGSGSGSDDDRNVHLSPAVPQQNMFLNGDSFNRRGSGASSEVLSPELAGPLLGRKPSSESLSTLRSFYDRKRSPLVVSQQTSASSARDLALRKGCPTIAEISIERPLSSYTTAGSGGAASPPRPVGSPTRTRTTTQPKEKKRTLQIDFSKLFPKPKSKSSGLLSPHRLTQSPSSLSLNSEYSGQSKPTKKLEKKQKKNKPHTDPLPVRPQTSHVSVKANKILGKPTLGGKEWFDVNTGFDDTDEDEASNMGDEAEPVVVEAEVQTVEIPSIPSTTISQDAIPPRRSSSGFHSRHRKTSSSHANGSLSAAQHIPAAPRSASAMGWDHKSIYSSSSKRTGGSTFLSSDLRNQSILSLSSSEDEDEEEEDYFSDGDTSISVPMSDGLASSVNRLKSSVGATKRVSTSSQSSMGSKARLSARPKTAPDDTTGPPSRPPSQLCPPLPSQYTRSQKTVFRRSSLRDSISPDRPDRPDHQTDNEGDNNPRRIVSVTPAEEAMLQALRATHARTRRPRVSLQAVCDAPDSNTTTTASSSRQGSMGTSRPHPLQEHPVEVQLPFREPVYDASPRFAKPMERDWDDLPSASPTTVEHPRIPRPQTSAAPPSHFAHNLTHTHLQPSFSTSTTSSSSPAGSRRASSSAYNFHLPDIRSTSRLVHWERDP